MQRPCKSADGVLIHYDVQGNESPALLFVHGWCCDRHVWDGQVGHFASDYTVVRLDLAGHGASGRARARWTMEAFGGDVAAVVEQLGLDQVVLIGHSMGGAVIVEAARLLPNAAIGLVGADTWRDPGPALTPQQLAEVLAPFRADFVEATRAFVRSLFIPASPARLTEAMVTFMSEMSPQIGVDVGEQVLAYDRVMMERLQEVHVPKIAINAADYRPTNREAAQRCGVELVLMSGVGHFVMMEDALTFNRLLGETVRKLVHLHAPR
jgi:pimeloyl-ACP methyl ester carboxylesterase